MVDRKLTKEEIKALEAQIKSDQDKSVRGNEKRLKLNISFTEAIDKIAKNIKHLENLGIVINWRFQ